MAEEKSNRNDKFKTKEKVLVSLASFVGKLDDSKIQANKTVLPLINNLNKSTMRKPAKKLREVPEGFLKPKFSEKIDQKLTNAKVFKHIQESYPLNTEQIYLSEPGPVEYTELLREKSAGVLEL